MLGPSLIPFGDLEGRVSVEIDVRDVDLDDDTALVSAVLRAMTPGTAAVRLAHAPWGSSQLDRSLMILAADARTAEVEVWARRSVHETRWSAVPVWWCLDASSLFKAPLDAAGLVQGINSLPFLPQSAEVVVIEPHEQAIAAVLLDELHTRLDTGAGWIYLDRSSPAWATAERALADAATAWGLRELRQ